MQSSREHKVNQSLSNISECKHIKDFLKKCHFDSFIILDLDNTVVESSEELGGDQWFYSLLQHANQLKLDSEEAKQTVNILYHAVQYHIHLSAVESTVVKVINALQEIGIPVLALTARSEEIIDVTVDRLAKLGIRFSDQWARQSFKLLTEDGKSIQYHDGILFCNGHDKGKSLKAFYPHLNFKFKHVVMMDDKHHHLVNVEKVVKQLGGKFSGLRYSYLDEKVKKFEITKAHIQLSKISHLFNDKTKQAIDKLKLPVDECKEGKAFNLC